MISMKLVLIASLVLAFACVFIKLPSDQRGSNESSSPLVRNFDSVSFELKGSSAKSYNDFMDDLRKALRGSDVKKFPMLRGPKAITDKNRFLLVKLSNSAAKLETTLAVRMSDAYVVGFCCGKYDQKKKKDTAWFFDDTKEFEEQYKLLFKDKKHELLGYKGNYDTLGNRDAPLGPVQMGASIEILGDTERSKGTSRNKKSLVVLLRMVAEATRFRYISDKVAPTMQDSSSFEPDSLMISYPISWGDLSTGVVNSDKNGVFQIKDQVVLKDDNGKVLKTVTKVDDIKNDLSLLKFVKT